MSASAYLWDRVARSYLTPKQDQSVQRSFLTLRERAFQHFESSLTMCLPFGSFMRGTNLSRACDPDSDVDVMLVFNDARYTPQTYLNWVRAFVTARYPSSEIEQSSPVIRLDLDHIRFEVVPALQNFYGFQIPAPASNYVQWMQTDPAAIEKKMVERDQTHNSLLRPTTRLLKDWNVTAGKPFASFELEKLAIEKGWPYASTIEGYFFEALMSVSAYMAPQWVSDEVRRAQVKATFAADLTRQGRLLDAERVTRQVFRDN